MMLPRLHSTRIRRRFKVEPPPCAEATKSPMPPKALLAAAGNRQLALKELYEAYIKGCKSRKSLALPNTVKSGPIKETFDDWRKAVERLESLEAALQNAKNNYEEALKEYNSATTKVAKAGKPAPDLKGRADK